MVTENGQHVLEVSSGGGEPPAMKITPGSEVGPISLGTEGAWRVVAAGVAPKHAYLFYDGQRLFLQSLNPGVPALVDGKPVPDEWTELSAPCEIALGEARLTFAALDGAPMESSPNVPAPAPSGMGPAAPDAGGRPFSPGEFSRRDNSEVTRLDDIVPSGRGPSAPAPAAASAAGGGAPTGAAEEEPEIPTRVHSPLFPGGPGGLPVGMVPMAGEGPGPASRPGPMPAAGRSAHAVVGQTPPSVAPLPGTASGGQMQMPVTPPGSFSPLGPPPSTELPSGTGASGAGVASAPKGWWASKPLPRKLIYLTAPFLMALVLVMKVPALKSRLLPGLGKKPVPAATTSPSGSAPAGSAAPPVGTDTGDEVDPTPRADGAGGAMAVHTGGAGTGEETAAGTADTAKPAAPQRTWGSPAKVEKSMERKATDALASGDFVAAAELYEKLAEQHPDNPVYQEAAEIVRAKAGPAD